MVEIKFKQNIVLLIVISGESCLLISTHFPSNDYNKRRRKGPNKKNVILHYVLLGIHIRECKQTISGYVLGQQLMSV